MRTVTLSIFSVLVLLAPAARGHDYDGGTDADPDPAPVQTADAGADAGGGVPLAADDLAYEADIDFPEEQASPDDFVDDEELVQDQYVADNYDDGYDPQAYQQFQEELAPHGTWVEDPTYGQVWQPSVAAVGPEFVPYYTNGNWANTEYGWTWASDYSWGWAPFHYGRWVVIGGLGWSWIPGTMWGPAWVSWRSGGGYVGWAPMPPRGVRVPNHFGKRSAWRFVDARKLGHPKYDCVPPNHAKNAFRKTRTVWHDRTIKRGKWAVHTNAGPVRDVRRKAARLADTAPHVMPKRAIYPKAGTPTSSRPWVRHATANPGAGKSWVGRAVAPPPGQRGDGRTGWTGTAVAPPPGQRGDGRTGWVGTAVAPPPGQRGDGRTGWTGTAVAPPPGQRQDGRTGWTGTAATRTASAPVPSRPIATVPRSFPSAPTFRPNAAPSEGPRVFHAGDHPSRVVPRMPHASPSRDLGGHQIQPSTAGTPAFQPSAPRIQAPGPSFSSPQPQFNQPRPSFTTQPQFNQPRPSFQAPAPQFQQQARPSFQAPAPQFNQPRPSFQAPAPQMHRPSFAPAPQRAPAPSFQPRPSGGGNFGAGAAGARVGGHFGGGRR